jgi:hypothetical protein
MITQTKWRGQPVRQCRSGHRNNGLHGAATRRGENRRHRAVRLAGQSEAILNLPSAD